MVRRRGSVDGGGGHDLGEEGGGGRGRVALARESEGN